MRACAAKLGRTRGLYSTDATVADLNDLRQALGAGTWTIDGVSYGTFVSERYAIAHPKAVRALVLDSVLPHVDPQADDALYLTGLKATGRVLRAACADLGCGFDPADDLAWVVRHGVAPVPLWDAIVTYEFVDPEYQRMIDAIHQARHGAPGALRTLVTQIHQAGGAPPELFSSGLHAATLCADMRFPWSSTTPVAAPAGAPGPAHEDGAGERRLAVHARDPRAQRLLGDVQGLAVDAGRAVATSGV